MVFRVRIAATVHTAITGPSTARGEDPGVRRGEVLALGRVTDDEEHREAEAQRGRRDPVAATEPAALPGGTDRQREQQPGAQDRLDDDQRPGTQRDGLEAEPGEVRAGAREPHRAPEQPPQQARAHRQGVRNLSRNWPEGSG